MILLFWLEIFKHVGLEKFGERMMDLRSAPVDDLVDSRGDLHLFNTPVILAVSPPSM